MRNMEFYGIPKIAVPIVGKTRAEILHQAERIAASCADLAEWRADHYEKLTDAASVTELMGKLKDVLGEKALLFTVRTRREGGEVELAPAEYANILLSAVLKAGVELVDVELSAGEETLREVLQKVHSCGSKAVVSYHNFFETPDEAFLEEKFLTMAEAGADILKIAVMPKSREDVKRMMEVAHKVSAKTKKPLVAISMGEMGKETRYMGETFGSCITFGTLGESSAPGQMECGELKELLEKVHGELR